MVEAWKRKPTVSDLKKLADVETFDDLMKTGSSNGLRSSFGERGSCDRISLGFYIIWQWLG